MIRYKGELEMALQNDCIRWNLELSIEDDDFEVYIFIMNYSIGKDEKA